MKLTLTKSGKRMKVQRETPPFLDVVNLDIEKQRETLARKLGIDAQWLLNREPGEYEYTPPVVTTSLDVTVRSMGDAGSSVTASGDAYTVIREALSLDPTQFTDPVITWKGTEDACFLDVDYHHIPESDRPGTLRLQFIMARIQPQPCLWFASRNGGVHALYIRQGDIPADVLGAVAAFGYRSCDSTAVFDLLPHSRLPTSQVFQLTPTTDLNAARRFLVAGVDEGEVTKWLDEKGLSRGTAYDHSYCPYEPAAESKGKPVWYGDNGVRCHRCEAKGVLWGSRYPGFFPYSVVVGSHTSNEVATMVRNFTHWTHAEVVLDAKCRLKGKHARLAYEGMLRLVHGDDDRIARVFQTGEYLLRGVGKWVTPDRYETIGQCRPTLASLPSVCDSAGRPISERLDVFDSTVDISRYGYVPLRPLHGMRVFGEFLGGDATNISLVVPPANLPRLQHPRYVPAPQRLPIEDAWERVEQVFPGLNRNYLLLLIAARGIAESESSMPANIMVTGTTGTGKSSVALLAASMIGDGCNEILWVKDPQRFRQAYMDSADAGMYVVVNEVFKCAKQERTSPRQAMDVFLNLTPNSRSWQMYVGSVKLGRLPVTIVTDTYVPSEIRSDLQVGRRFIYVRLDGRKEWETTLAAHGIGQDCNYRAHSPESAEACNAIVSHVIDRWFRDKVYTMNEIAEELGFTTLEHCDEVIDDPDAIPELYRQICDAPEHTDSRHPGKGWRRIEFGTDTLLARSWEAVCDGLNSFEAFSNSRKCFETDLSCVLPVPIGSRIDISKTTGKAILVRFRYGATKGRGDYAVNEELLTCQGQRR